MRRFAIKSDRLVLPSGIDGFGYLIVEDGVFGEVSVEEPKDMQVIDHMGNWVAPGFVDTHIHGYRGHDVMDATPEAIDAISLALASEGTTGWLATTMSAPAAETAAACSAVATYCKGKQEGARCLGVFLEGPFFTEEHSGAQDQSFLVDPDLGLLEAWQRAAEGLIVKSALAPEREGATAYIRSAREHGIVCALGHSSASYGQGAQCVLAGANVVVHTFNGMADLAHRDPGLVGLAMTSQGVYAELIADGVHVDPVCCEALVRAKGFEHVVLVSDCLMPAGLDDAELSGLKVPVDLRDGACFLVGTDTLAGSVLTLARAVKNVCDWGIVTAEQAIRMASEVAARSVGLDGVCGQILPGRSADLTILDGELNLVETFVRGRRY